MMNPVNSLARTLWGRTRGRDADRLHPDTYITPNELPYTREAKCKTVTDCKCKCTFGETSSKIIEKCV